LNYFLGFQIKQLQDGTFISQTKYTQEFLKKFGVKDSKPIKTPMGSNGHLDLDTASISIDQKEYRSIRGSLFYYVLLNRTLCFLYACVQDSNPTLRNIT